MAASKKSTSKKSAVKKTTTKKPASTKKVTKKTSSKKTEAKKSTAKKTTKKTVKKTTTRKQSGVFRCSISGIPVKAEKPNISPKTIKKLEELLIQERKRHVDQADELAQEAVDLMTDREAGDTVFDEESGEGDSVAVERERTLFLSAEARNTVDQIDRALARIKDGSYGVCVPSSRRISVARLEALPWTEVCVDCKARSERRR